MPAGTIVAGRYRVEKLLGEGAMGAVYLVEHVHMRKRFALKVLLSEARENPEIVARFEREAIAAAHVDHPNVVAASDFGTTEDGAFFLVLEYIEGESLRDLVERGPLPLRRVVDIALQIGAALGKAHGMGIVHRDLKPENVMLVPREGEPDLVKVLDFGIAKVPSRDAKALTAVGAIFGTPEYLSPEQAVGQTVDARADLYSFGIILFELLAGKRPFDCEHVMGYLAAHLNTPVPPIAEIAPEIRVPPAVEAVIRQMLAKVPEDRQATVKDAVVALEAAAEAVFVGESDDGFSGPSPSPSPASTARVFSQEDASAKTLLPGQELSPPPKGHASTSANTSTFASALATYTSESIAHAKGFVTVVDGMLPASVRALPAVTKVGAVAAVGVVFLVVFAALVSGARAKPVEGLAAADAEAEQAAPALSDETIGRAETEGPAAVEKLVAEFPTDPRVHRAKVRVLRAEAKTKDALAALERLIEVEPAVAKEPLVYELLVEAFDGDPESAAAAAALSEKTGAKGVDALLACVAKPAKSKKSCAERLSTAKVREGASPAAKILLDFKDAQSCQSKYTLLDRAKDEGDARLLPSLKPLTYTSGCGFFRGSDCWKCLRRDKKLPEAIAGIEGRAPSP